MNKTLMKLTSTFLLSTLLGTLLMTNAVETASAQSTGSQVSTLAAQDGPACQVLSPGEMAALSGSGWADWAVRLIDLGCVAGSAAATLRMASPFVGAFCAGWAIGRYLGG